MEQKEESHMHFNLTGKNLYIVNKNPQSVQSIENIGAVLLLKDEEDGVLNEGKIDLSKEVYAGLYCKQLKNIIFIINRETVFCVSLILATEIQFENVLQFIREACPTLELSEQNAKINGYAASVVEKLQEGVAVKILETKEEEKVKCCPVCGMQCDPNIPYCMECGASV